MTEKKTAFFAYPTNPRDIGQSIQKAVETFNGFGGCDIECWEQNDISGLPLVAPIFSKIAEASFLAADITYLNENVAFEIGYPCRRASVMAPLRTFRPCLSDWGPIPASTRACRYSSIWSLESRSKGVSFGNIRSLPQVDLAAHGALVG